MLMHATAHGSCTDTVRESALKIDSGRRKKTLPLLGPEPASVLRLAFQSDALPTERKTVASEIYRQIQAV